MKEKVMKTPMIILTISCPLPLYEWLKRSQRNVSAYVVAAIESKKRRSEDRLPVHETERQDSIED